MWSRSANQAINLKRWVPDLTPQKAKEIRKLDDRSVQRTYTGGSNMNSLKRGGVDDRRTTAEKLPNKTEKIYC